MIRIFSSHTSDIRSATQSSACSLVCRCEKIPVTLRAAEVDPRRASLESSMRGRLRPAASDAARARAANAEADAPRPMFDSKLFSETTRAWLLILERSLTRSKTVVTCSYLSSSIGDPFTQHVSVSCLKSMVVRVSEGADRNRIVVRDVQSWISQTMIFDQALDWMSAGAGLHIHRFPLVGDATYQQHLRPYN